jgi:membrane associated rhomboid family serine protease
MKVLTATLTGMVMGAIAFFVVAFPFKGGDFSAPIVGIAAALPGAIIGAVAGYVVHARATRRARE